MEDTLVILKPDGVNKKILLEVIKRFLDNGLLVSNLKAIELDKKIIREHYNHLINLPFYSVLEEYMLSGVVVVMIVSGKEAISKVREIIGATDPKVALPHTIRGQYGDKECMTRNVIHASDSKENAMIEIKRFYQEENEEIDKTNRVYQKRR